MSLYSLDPNQAQLLYYNSQVKYFAKLQQKLDAGEITQQKYDNEVTIFSNGLENPDNLLAQAGDFNPTQFWQDVKDTAGSTIAYAQQGVADAMLPITQTLQTASSTANNVSSAFTNISAFPGQVLQKFQDIASGFGKVAIAGIVLLAIYLFCKKK